MSSQPDPAPDHISWQAERTTIPDRPAFGSGLPAEQRVARPPHLCFALALCCLSAALIAAEIIVGAIQLDTIKAGLMTSFPADIREEYSADELSTAVNVLLGALAGLAAVLSACQVFSMGRLMLRRRPGARLASVVLFGLTLVVCGVALIVREANPVDLGLAGTALLCLLLSLVGASTPRVSRWLRQSEERRSIAIARSGLSDV